MRENLFEHYVLGGGWTMLILIPASIVAAATAFRAISMLYGRPAQRLAAQVYGAVTAQKARGSLSVTDARSFAQDSALSLYAALQPLAVIYAAAPFVGALGTVWSLGRVWRGAVSLQGRNLALALENAFVPLGWGLWIALFSIICFGILKARVAKVELDIITPAAISALNDPGERRAGDRKL